MAVEIIETDRNTLLVNGKEIYRKDANWMLLDPVNTPDLNHQEKLALMNYMHGGKVEPPSRIKPILEEVHQERIKQDAKWGANRDHAPWEWLMILGEEVGEANRHALEAHFGDLEQGAYQLIDYRKELIQIAAVAVAMAECFDRQLSELQR